MFKQVPAFLIFLAPIWLCGQVIIPSSGIVNNFGSEIFILEDKGSQLGIEEVLTSENFKKAKHEVPNLNISNSCYWVKISLLNQSESRELLIALEQPNLDDVRFYFLDNDKIDSILCGDFIPIKERIYPNQNYVFPIEIEKNEMREFYFRIRADDQIQLPFSIGTVGQINQQLNTKDIAFGLFAGIMIAILLYNMFIFLKVREKIYGLYILYLAVIFVTQANLHGYTLRFFWPFAPEIERICVYFLIALSGITGLIFIMNYIHLDRYLKPVVKLFYGFIGVYCFALLLVGFKQYGIAFKILEINGSIIAISVLAVTYKVWRSGNKQAGNLLLAWSAFFAGLLFFVLKDLGVLPHNDLTVYTMTIGSAIEGILLSFGLADRINQLKLEKEESDAMRIKAIESQNEVLEVKVHERTAELEEAKDHIQAQYDHLRITQKQLLESEKLAGLGQMTAGIAHELNNPINFVSSNVGPLHRDIEDVVNLLNDYQNLPENPSAEEISALKTKYVTTDIDYVQKEIHQLLKGIEEGSKRTAEIVRGLRIFARADKDTLVSANINECLQSTIVVMKSVTKGEVILTKEFASDMPHIECFPGKLNQVIANLVSNAVYATKQKGKTVSERQIEIRSYHDEKFVHISVKDNGCGISDELKENIFVPFFTTKNVGEGTGLGLSIAMGIIEEHQGEIEVVSTPGVGSEFIIHLPRTRKGFSLSAA